VENRAPLAQEEINALNAPAAEDVTAQVVLGPVQRRRRNQKFGVIPMQAIGRDGSGIDPFGTVIKPSARTGRHGHSIRVLPQNPDLISSLPAEEDGFRRLRPRT